MGHGMSGFGGRADVIASGPELPVLATSGHKAEGWRPELLRKQDVRSHPYSIKPRLRIAAGSRPSSGIATAPRNTSPVRRLGDHVDDHDACHHNVGNQELGSAQHLHALDSLVYRDMLQTGNRRLGDPQTGAANPTIDIRFLTRH